MISFVSGQIYTNSKQEKSTKVLLSLFILATYVWECLLDLSCGWITDNYKTLEGEINWQMVWIPAGIAFVVFLLLPFV
jgi:hypothetical protein